MKQTKNRLLNKKMLAFSTSLMLPFQAESGPEGLKATIIGLTSHMFIIFTTEK